MNLTQKMEKWLETRLWNLRVKNEPVVIQQISSELIDFFGLTVTRKTKKDLISEIERIRFRTYKRYEKWCVIRKEWSTQLALTEKFIQRWYFRGWIDPQKSDSLPNIMGMIFERDYYLMFIAKKKIDDHIPEAPGESIFNIRLIHKLFVHPLAKHAAGTKGSVPRESGFKILLNEFRCYIC